MVPAPATPPHDGLVPGPVGTAQPETAPPPETIPPASKEAADAAAPLPSDDGEPAGVEVPCVDRLPAAVWIVAVAGAAERFAYYSMSAPLQNYIQNDRRGGGNPGALGLGQQAATTITNCFLLVQFVAPTLFAVLSDMRLGRFKTIIVSLTIYQVGCLILLLTSLPAALERGAGLPGLLTAIIFIALGVAGVKATLPPFLLDQYANADKTVLRVDGRRTLVADRGLTVQYITNLFFWMGNIAALSTLAATFIEKEVDFWAANLLGTVLVSATQALLWFSGPRLRKLEAHGSAFPLTLRALWCAMRNRCSLAAAAPERERQRGREPAWTDETIADLRKTLTVSRLLFCSSPFYLAYIQINNNLISQAGQMRLMGVPNDTMQIWNPVACVLLGPVVQNGLFPLLRRARVSFRPVARIATACFVMGVAMALAAGLQRLIYARGPCYDRPLACAAAGAAEGNDVAVWVQMPVWFVIALGEILGFATISEIAYGWAPGSMRSLVQAMTQLTAGLATLMGIALSPVTRDPTLVILYAVIAGLTGLAAVLFWAFFRTMDRSR